MLVSVVLQRLPITELLRTPVARERLGSVEMDPVVVPVEVEGLARAVLAHVALEHLRQVLPIRVAEVEDRVGVRLPVPLPHVLEKRLRRRRLEVAVGAHERLTRRLFAAAGSFRFRLAEKLEEDVRLPDVEAEHLKQIIPRSLVQILLSLYRGSNLQVQFIQVGLIIVERLVSNYARAARVCTMAEL